MRRVLGHLPSPAMVVGLIALFFALGGVGYAKKVVHLINGSTIKKGSIQVDRLSSRARAALKGNRGLQGFQGPQGLQGAQGPKGDTGPSTGAAGGDLTGSYPNPAIAAGAVTGAKVAASSLRLSNTAIATTTIDLSVGTLAHDTCITVNKALSQSLQAGDVSQVVPSNGNTTGIVAFGEVQTSGTNLQIEVCNFTATNINFADSFYVWVVRPT